MRDPSRIKPDVRRQALALKRKDPLRPLNLFNITWKQDDLSIPHVVLPRELTGLDANIVVMIALHFPTGAHKVGPATVASSRNRLRANSSLAATAWCFPRPATTASAARGSGRA